MTNGPNATDHELSGLDGDVLPAFFPAVHAIMNYGELYYDECTPDLASVIQIQPPH